MTKQVFLLLIVCLFSASLRADDKKLNLRYDFKVGDEFAVKVCAYAISRDAQGERFMVMHENRTSLEYYLAFRSLEKYNDSTAMEVEIKRMVLWNRHYCFDTYSGFPPLNEGDRFIKNIVGSKYQFTINAFGEVNNLKRTDNGKDDLEQASSFQDYRNAELTKRWAFASLVTQSLSNEIVQSAFPLFYSHDTIEKRTQKEANVRPWPLGVVKKINDEQTIVYNPLDAVKKKGRIVISRVGSAESGNEDVLKENEIAFFRQGKLEKTDITLKDTLVFDSAKGRILSGAYQSLNGSLWGNFVRTEYISDAEFKEPATIKLSGRIANWRPQNVKLYIWKKYPDYHYLNHDSLLVNADGTFQWQLPLTRPVEATLRVDEPGAEGSYAKELFLEPGDELELGICAPESGEWVVQGESALKVQLQREIEQALTEFSERGYTSESEFELAINHLMDELTDKVSKADISIWAKKHLKATVFAKCYYTGHRAYKFDFADSKNLEQWKSRWFNNYKIWEFYSFPSMDFRNFIKSFVRDKIEAFRQGANYTKPDLTALNTYNLTKNLLDLEGRYYLLAYQIGDLIKRGDIAVAEQLFKDYAELYPETEMTAFYAQYLGDASQITVGHQVPDFTAETQGGRQVSFESLKGKWIHLFFASMEDDFDLPVLESLGKVTDYLDDDRFMPVVVLTDPVITAKTLEKIRSVYAGKLLFNPGWKYESTKYFNVSYQRPAFLINPDGQFESTWDRSIPNSVNDNNDKSKKWYAALLKGYMDLKEEQFSRAKIYKSQLYWMISSVAIAGLLLWLFFYQRNRRLKKREALKREKIQLELKAIRSQLNPHFMFNTLNSIQHLVMDERTEDATHYISEFSGLMRQVLQHSNKELVPLNEEIKSVEAYLELEALRFGFKYNVEVDENLDIYNIEIPGLLLQPFVENAVVHGISAIREKGCIRVRYVRKGNELVCIVDDNGGGYYPVKEKMVNGQGIALSERRLQMISETFSGQVSMEITNKADVNPHENGTLVQISFELDHAG